MTKVEITKRMPKGSWMYVDNKGNMRYTPLFILIHKLAHNYDNSATFQGRQYDRYIAEMIQADLIDYDMEYIPSVNSILVYLNKQESFNGSYQNTSSTKKNRQNILSKVCKIKK